MARLVALLLCGLLACRAGTVVETPGQAGAGPEHPLAYERFVLDNGLEVALHEDHRLPLVAVNLTYHVGSMHDGAHPGLAHLVEHLMFRGTANVRDGEFSRMLQHAGGVAANASTHLDKTEYYAVVPSEQLPLLLWLESDRMGNAARALSKPHVKEEVTTTRDEWRTRVAGTTYGLVTRESFSALFPAPHPLHPATPAEMGRLQLRDATEFMNRYYGPANATLVLAGDLPADVREIVTRTFASRSGGQRPTDPDTTVAGIEAEHTVELESEFATTPLLILVWPTPGFLQPGDAEADIVADALNAGAFETLAHSPEGEMLLEVHAAQHSYVGQSMFTIVAQGREGAPPSALLALVDTALASFKSEAVSQANIDRAVKHFEVRGLEELQGLAGRAARLQRALKNGTPSGSDQALARYRAVTPESATRFAASHLGANQRIVLKAHPTERTP